MRVTNKKRKQTKTERETSQVGKGKKKSENKDAGREVLGRKMEEEEDMSLGSIGCAYNRMSIVVGSNVYHHSLSLHIIM